MPLPVSLSPIQPNTMALQELNFQLKEKEQELRSKKDELVQMMINIAEINEKLCNAFTRSDSVKEKIGRAVETIEQGGSDKIRERQQKLTRTSEDYKFILDRISQAERDFASDIDFFETIESNRAQKALAEVEKIQKFLTTLELMKEAPVSSELSHRSITSKDPNEIKEENGALEIAIDSLENANRILLEGLQAMSDRVRLNAVRLDCIGKLLPPLQKNLQDLYEPLKKRMIKAYAKALAEEVVRQPPISDGLIEAADLGLTDEWMQTILSSEKYKCIQEVLSTMPMKSKSTAEQTQSEAVSSEPTNPTDTTEIKKPNPPKTNVRIGPLKGSVRLRPFKVN